MSETTLDAAGARCVAALAGSDDDAAVAAVAALRRHPWPEVVAWLCAEIVQAAPGWDEEALATLTSRRLPVAGLIEAVVLAVVSGDVDDLADLAERDAVETVVLLGCVAAALG